jgi:hypothetical protein
LIQEQPERNKSSYFAAKLAGAAALIVLAGFVFWPGRQSPQAGGTSHPHLTFSAEAQTYAPQVRIEKLKLSQAENFLNQEITILSGTAVNSGNRALRGIQVEVLLSDEFGQTVLRESRFAANPAHGPLAAGASRDFEFSFEHVPSSWNMQLPTVRVSGIEFTDGK